MAKQDAIHFPLETHLHWLIHFSHVNDSSETLVYSENTSVFGVNSEWNFRKHFLSVFIFRRNFQKNFSLYILEDIRPFLFSTCFELSCNIYPCSCTLSLAHGRFLRVRTGWHLLGYYRAPLPTYFFEVGVRLKCVPQYFIQLRCWDPGLKKYDSDQKHTVQVSRFFDSLPFAYAGGNIFTQVRLFVSVSILSKL